MDPITTVAVSLALGVGASGGTTLVNEAAKDAYGKLKALLKRDHPTMDIAKFESKTELKDIVRDVKIDLLSIGGDQSFDLMQAAHQNISMVNMYAPMLLEAIGVDLREITGNDLTIDNITAPNTGVKVENAKMTGNIKISGVRAGADLSKP